MRKRIAVFLLGLVFCGAAPLAAQWDAPSFFSPRPGEDLGIYVFDAEGGDLGFAGIWRQEGNLNLGVRAGIAGSDRISVGAEFYGPLDLLGPQSGLLFSWILGLGATFNEVTTLRVPLGASVGLRLGSPGSLQLLPYVHPRVAFELSARDTGAGEETDTDFNVDVDLGADAPLGESFVLRVGVTIGRTTTFGGGIAYRMPRRIAVR